MPVDFGERERYIRSLFRMNSVFNFQDQSYRIILCGKPTCALGEPKTDIYVAAISDANRVIELKISFKKSNADFLENKISAERAQGLFGENWMRIASDSVQSIADSFFDRPLIYYRNYGRTTRGSITLGWKFELTNKYNGDLSGPLTLSHAELCNIYSGVNSTIDKKNAYVEGRIIPDSGVATYMFIDQENSLTLQKVVNDIITIEQYVAEHNDLFFACKALNFRMIEGRYDGNRPLAVYIDWNVKNNKLSGNFVFNRPLCQGGDYVADKLFHSLKTLGIRRFEDLREDMIDEAVRIYR